MRVAAFFDCLESMYLASLIAISSTARISDMGNFACAPVINEPLPQRMLSSEDGFGLAAVSWRSEERFLAFFWLESNRGKCIRTLVGVSRGAHHPSLL